MCTFRDSLDELKEHGAQVIGISIDGPFANKIFTENRHLNFPILSDYKHEVINRYGIVMKDLASLKDYNAAKRSIFIIDGNGKVQYRWVSDNPMIEPNYQEIKHVIKNSKIRKYKKNILYFLLFCSDIVSIEQNNFILLFYAMCKYICMV